MSNITPTMSESGLKSKAAPRNSGLASNVTNPEKKTSRLLVRYYKSLTFDAASFTMARVPPETLPPTFPPPQVKLNGEKTHSHESYAEPMFNSLGVEADGVYTVTLASILLEPDEWISLLEVGNLFCSFIRIICCYFLRLEFHERVSGARTKLTAC